MNNKLKVLDLFSGIGGFSLGLHSTGIFDTVKFVEIDKFCQKVLNKNFPGIPIEEDIKNVKGQEFEADVITGGFPCQPFSVAGKQKGTNDNRYLWPEMLRLIKEIKPEFVIGENVQGLINLQNGMVLRQVQDQLEGEGFEVQCFLIPASGIGAWHQRNRVWIIGHSKTNGLLKAEYVSNTNNTRGGASEHGIEREGQKADEGWKEQSQSESSRHDEDVSNSTIRRWQECKSESKEKNDISETCANVSNTISELSDGCSSTTRDSKTEFIRLECNEGWHWNKIRSETERCGKQSKSTNQTWWQIESNLCGVPDGISYGLDKGRVNRIKSLGNAIVPQCARIIGLAIKKVLIEEGRE